MIKYSDLRLGNWILDRGTPTQVTMLSIGMNFYCINGVHLDKKTGKVLKTDEDRFKPIELTHEILVACGFSFTGFRDHEKSIAIFAGQYKVLNFAGDYLYLREGNKEDRRENDNLCVLWNKDIKRKFYLHKLQNLYADLTEHELSYHPSTLSEKTG